MIIQKTIEINTSAWAFWNALRSTQNRMETAGYYECNWEVNSRINWIAAEGSGSFYGKLLQIREQQYLSYLKYDNYVRNKVIALISYQIRPCLDTVVIRVSADLMQKSNKTDEDHHAHWLAFHLDELVALAQKIHLENSKLIYLA